MASSQGGRLLNLVLTLTLGALAGAAAAVLLVPQSGRATRDQLRRRLGRRGPAAGPVAEPERTSVAPSPKRVRRTAGVARTKVAKKRARRVAGEASRGTSGGGKKKSRR